MRARLALGLAMLLMSACTRDSFPRALQPTPSERVLPAQNHYYGPPEPAIRNLLVRSGHNDRINHFCVVGYAFPDGVINFWVHWQEARELRLWRGNSDQPTREQGLVRARRSLELGQDTVDTEDQLKGSTYMVTRAWWQAVAEDCAAHGQKFTIEPFAAPKPEKSEEESEDEPAAED